MSKETTQRIEALARDHNVDLEDLRHVLAAAQADGSITLDEEEALRAHLDAFEPAARRYLEDVLAGRAGPPPQRVLLAAHPPSAQKDLYYPRVDVVALQESLARAGFATNADGLFGPGTAKQVGELQAALGLPRTGALDSATLLALNERLAARGEPPLDINPRARIRPDTVVLLRGAGKAEHNRALQKALAGLEERIGVPGLKIDVDGVFGGETERAVKIFQRVAYLPETGIVDVATVTSLNAALALEELPLVNIEVPRGGAGFQGKVELHFYPGPTELKVYVLREGELLGTYGMVGGRNEARADPNNPNVSYDPTPEGVYVVDAVSPQASMAWAYSYVPYGSPLREVDGEVQFRDGGGRWRWATGPRSEFAGRRPEPLPRKDYLEPDGRLMAAWMQNDFGHLRARLRRLSTSALQAHMIHSGPAHEATPAYFSDTEELMSAETAAAELKYSHGCEHIHPRDLDDMIARGYMAPGTRFVVHGYDEEFAGKPP